MLINWVFHKCWSIESPRFNLKVTPSQSQSGNFSSFWVNFILYKNLMIQNLTRTRMWMLSTKFVSCVVTKLHQVAWVSHLSLVLCYLNCVIISLSCCIHFHWYYISECGEYIQIFEYIGHEYIFGHSFVSIFLLRIYSDICSCQICLYKYIRTFVGECVRV